MRQAQSTISFYAILFFAVLALSGQSVAEQHIRHVSGPFTHENLSVYLIHGRSASGPVPLTLTEAMQTKLVRVHETGQIDRVLIENLSDQEVFIQSGDIVKGGKQDRVLAVSTLLSQKSGLVPIDAYCVESGRWGLRDKANVDVFASATRSVPSLELKLALKVAYLDAGASGHALWALPREPVSSQNRIWRHVAKVHEDLANSIGTRIVAPSSPSSLQLTLENESLKRAEELYLNALQDAGEIDDDVIGYAFAVNGKLNSADAYGSNGLFRKMWPKLLRASVTEAIAKKSHAVGETAPTADEVKAFLVRMSESTEQSVRLSSNIELKSGLTDRGSFFAAQREDDSAFHLNYIAWQ